MANICKVTLLLLVVFLLLTNAKAGKQVNEMGVVNDDGTSSSSQTNYVLQ